MAKKKVKDYDDEIEDELEDELEDESEYVDSDKENETEPQEEEDFDKGGNSFESDDDELDILIEIEDDDIDFTESTKSKNTDELDELEGESDIVLSKHKVEGKHSLKYDSIFKGKKEDPLDEDDMDGFSLYHKETIEVDKSSNYYFESIDNERYIRSKLVKEKVYLVLEKHTNINFMNNRRKPSKIDFNNYYSLLKTHLEGESFSNIELFNELSVYFSDNLFNMFKLLENRWRNMIINELQDHIGRNSNSKELTNRNIYIDTEIEFEWEDEFGNEKIITGVVVYADYEESIFEIDSYEKIYSIHISKIRKILNNTKFKYNLNKLNNIDFL